MSIPKYDEMYREVLESLSDGQCHKISHIRSVLAAKLHLSEEDLRTLLPSGKQLLFNNRVNWTCVYLKRAGVVETPSRGSYRLTASGREVLNENPPIIDNAYLCKFPSFREFVHSVPDPVRPAFPPSPEPPQLTPQDRMDQAYQEINSALTDDLLNEVLRQSPIFFEHLVVKLLCAMGYGGSMEGAGTVTRISGDEGIDGIIREDKLGFSVIYIQAKRWECSRTVGRPDLQKFVGALVGQGADKGLFITTAQFTREAQEYAQKQHTTKIVLVDGTALAKLMIEYNVGVSVETTYSIKRIDSDFFDETFN